MINWRLKEMKSLRMKTLSSAVLACLLPVTAVAQWGWWEPPEPVSPTYDVSSDPLYTMCFRTDVGLTNPNSPEIDWADSRLIIRVEPPLNASDNEVLPGMGLTNVRTRTVNGVIRNRLYDVPVAGTAIITDSYFGDGQVWWMSVFGKSVQTTNVDPSISATDIQHLYTLNIQIPVDEVANPPMFPNPAPGWKAWAWNIRGPSEDAANIKVYQYDDWSPYGATIWRVPCNDPQHWLN